MGWYSREDEERYQEMLEDYEEELHGTAPAGVFLVEGEIERISDHFVVIDGVHIEVTPELWLDPNRSRYVSGQVSLEYRIRSQWREEIAYASHDDVVAALGDLYVKHPALIRLEADEVRRRPTTS